MRVPIHENCLGYVTSNSGWVEFHPEFRSGYDYAQNNRKNVIFKNITFKDYKNYVRGYIFYSQTISINRI